MSHGFGLDNESYRKKITATIIYISDCFLLYSFCYFTSVAGAPVSQAVRLIKADILPLAALSGRRTGLGPYFKLANPSCRRCLLLNSNWNISA